MCNRNFDRIEKAFWSLMKNDDTYRKFTLTAIDEDGGYIARAESIPADHAYPFMKLLLELPDVDTVEFVESGTLKVVTRISNKIEN